MRSADRDNRGAEAARALEARVWDALKAQDVDAAVACCRQLNAEHPGFAGGWHTASHLAIRLGRPRSGLAAIEKALAIDPDQPAWLLQKALCLDKLDQVSALPGLVDRLTAMPMRTAYELSALGMLLTRLGRRDAALEFYRRAAQLEPHEARHHYNMACMERSLGDVAAAEASFDRAISLAPEDYEAWKVRSELRHQTPDANHVAALERVLEEGIDDPRGEAQICYALAKELEDLGEYRRSFARLRQGAAARRGTMRYDVRRDIDTMAAIRETFTAGLFAAPPAGCDNDEAIFVLGLPRTGTTLVERILASHSDVHAAGELANFAVELTRLVRAGTGAPPAARDELVRRSAELDFRALGEAYVASTRPFTGRTPRFIDKMPLNYLYLGLIRLALPNARIVHLRRDPLDTCYAIFKQLFVDAYPFSYDLEELGRYYAAYDRLMRHWQAVLPDDAFLTVDYETLVDDFEPGVRRLLAFCRLDWQAACLRFHENPEASTTASTVQVRQPVYRSSVGKWRHYRAELAPLVAVLRDEGVPLAE